MRFVLFVVLASSVSLLARTAGADSLRELPSLASYDRYDPVDADGWPHRTSLEDIRDLRPCRPGERDHAASEYITCRPRVVNRHAPLAFNLDWTTGLVFDERTTGGTHALGGEVLYGASRTLQLGARYALTGIGNAAATANENKVAHHIYGVAKLRTWQDEAGRDGFFLGAGAGLGLRNDALGGAAPLVRVAVGREIGVGIGADSAFTSSVELAYERTLDDGGMSMLLASYRIGLERGIREPRNVGQPRPSASAWRSLTIGANAGTSLGADVGLGARLTRYLSLQALAGVHVRTSQLADESRDGYDGMTWLLVAGPRVQLARSAAPYVQALAGPAWESRLEGAALRALGQAEVGVRFAGCGGGVDAGVFLRGDLAAREVTTGGVLLRVALGTSAALYGRRDCERGGPYLLKTEEVVHEVETVERVRVEEVVRERETIRVTVFDLTLGTPRPGDAIQIDPRVVPRLRDVRHVEIQLSGPAHALAAAQTALTGAIEGRVDAWQLLPTDDPVVRARIVITP